MKKEPELTYCETGWQVEWHECLTSTMERATQLAEAGASPGTVVVANFQSHGRGTHGRTWSAMPGTCLMFTLVARPPDSPDTLSKLPGQVAYALAVTLRQLTGVKAAVSPPNDVTVGGKKIAGVLCTSRIRGEAVDWLLCGIGINTYMSSSELPYEHATSLVAEGVEPMPVHRDLLSEVLSALDWLRVSFPES